MINPRQKLDELRIAVMLLTRLPVGRITGPAPEIAQTRWAFALVGVPVGLIAWLAHMAASGLGLSPLIAGLVAIVALVLVTGGLHHDGLADFADGIGGGRDRDHCLEIMRDSRIGSYGVLALILTLALQAAAMADLGRIGIAFILIAVFSRFAMLVVLEFLPAARPDGLGHKAGAFRETALPVGAALCALCVLIGGTGAMIAVVAMALVALSVALLAHRRIGGQTGDVLGAVQLTTETAGWLVLAAVGGM